MVAEASPVSGLEPPAFWSHFEAITRIARPSHHEQAMDAHVRAWAAGHDLPVRHDQAGNLVIPVPARPGRESAPTVIVQGHMDMVCERSPKSPNDPAEGRIELVRDGEWLTADGTTLGADDGVGIAAMMSLVEDEAVEHGPLELLMTVAEEVGLEGASALDGSMLTGSVLLNLDSEDDGTLTVGCAGATDSWIRIRRPMEPVGRGAVTLAVTVSGGRGGHSGADIVKGRANAIKVLGRVLRDAYDAEPFRLASFQGGRNRNAIPRDAEALVCVPDGQAHELSTAVHETERDRLTLHSLTRSSNDSAMPGVLSTLSAAARLSHGGIGFKHNYGGWRPNLDSPALAAATRVFTREFGRAPVVSGVHAGLEPAAIGDRVPGLDMLSFGPQIEFAHSPDERVSIPTVERYWRLLAGLLDELSQP
jgi:di/tripeptidase